MNPTAIINPSEAFGLHHYADVICKAWPFLCPRQCRDVAMSPPTTHTHTYLSCFTLATLPSLQGSNIVKCHFGAAHRGGEMLQCCSHGSRKWMKQEKVRLRGSCRQSTESVIILDIIKIHGCDSLLWFCKWGNKSIRSIFHSSGAKCQHQPENRQHVCDVAVAQTWRVWNRPYWKHCCSLSFRKNSHSISLWSNDRIAKWLNWKWTQGRNLKGAQRTTEVYLELNTCTEVSGWYCWRGKKSPQNKMSMTSIARLITATREV